MKKKNISWLRVNSKDYNVRVKTVIIITIDELLSLDVLKVENIKDNLHAYQLAKICNEKQVMFEACRYSKVGARINFISPGIIVTQLAIDAFNGLRGDFYKNMFANCPVKRSGTADEMAKCSRTINEW